MLTVYTCMAAQHDLHLLVLAVFVCLIAAFAAMSLLHHVGSGGPSMRWVWTVVAAIATGFGIWATHFIAMLAFQPTVPSGYNVLLTVLSLLMAIVLTGFGFALASSSALRYGRWAGGVVVGLGIAVMHYTGMAAFEIAARIVWDPALMLVSVLLGVGLGAVAIPAALKSNSFRWKAIGAVLLTTAICSLHSTAMGAAVIIPDPRIVMSAAALPAGWLAVGIAVVSVGIIVLAAAGVVMDVRDRRAAAEATRMRELAEATVEGVIIHREGSIVTANRSFVSLARASSAAALVGQPVSGFFVGMSLRGESAGEPLEAMLRAKDSCGDIAVELIEREVIYGGNTHQVLAVRDIRERKKAEAEIQFLAHHDPLTRLPNRASFNLKLRQELAAHRDAAGCLAILLLDLDRFKEINNLYGHPAGDAALEFVARRIKSVLKPSQMAARLGGDEFAVIVPGLTAPAYASRTAEAILKALCNASDSLPPGVTIGTSIGIASFPNDATDVDTLVGHADAALYEAKAQGRGVFRFYEPRVGTSLRERRQLKHDVGQALARGELSLVYQPQADLKSGQIFGFEALLRWDHSTRGNVPPAEFIPVAEECGAILKIGDWVLRSACAEAACWLSPLAVAVNVSTAQLLGGRLPELVREVLADTGLEPSRLELEITEATLVEDAVRALAALGRLKALGVRIAMDDFGTGYSSLTNLRAFPFDRLKMDESFVRAVHVDAEAAAMIRAVFGLARGLRLSVIAEGVETEGELSFLRGEACDAVQGYLLGSPAPIQHFHHITSGHPPAIFKRDLRLVGNA
jgi:diguanylate cyclase